MRHKEKTCSPSNPCFDCKNLACSNPLSLEERKIKALERIANALEILTDDKGILWVKLTDAN